jgi:hypothetical protein
MIDLPVLVAYGAGASSLFVAAYFAEKKWLPLIFGVVVSGILALSLLFPKPEPLEYLGVDYLAFWILAGAGFALGCLFSVQPSAKWAGLGAAMALSSLCVLTAFCVLLLGTFPALPGSEVSVGFLPSLASVTGLGLELGGR